MPGTNENIDNINNEDQSDKSNDVNQTSDNDLKRIEELAQKKVDENLKDIKSKLDKAYGSRDEALKKLAELEQEKRAQELKRLQDEGKFKEAFELQLSEERAKREALEQRNVTLTRDIEVRNALSAQPFRNENASEMAYREIVGQLVRNEKEEWVHVSGLSLKDYVKAFADNEANSFLFKPKASSGSGSSGSKTTDSSGGKKSLFSMSQDEVLKMAREGKLQSR